MIKYVNGYDISSKIEGVQSIRKAKHWCKNQMFRRPRETSYKENPDHIVFHIGTNDLPTDKSPDVIANSIVNLAMSAKTTTCDVSISNITFRNDKHRQKARDVNTHLKELCKEKNIYLIDHENIITRQHLNMSRLHLNKRGTSIFTRTFTREIL